ncbi:MAG: hypothetical protein EKK55_24490 [Rhodocyclaceae bacterium]|nr:MAG: hypothetical protein EKK55_24490 [Rhodocyclaceae bacterium]
MKLTGLAPTPFTAREAIAHEKFFSTRHELMLARGRGGAPRGVVLTLERRARRMLAAFSPRSMAFLGDAASLGHVLNRGGSADHASPGAALLRRWGARG